MFEDSRVVDPALGFAVLAAAIDAIPIRPDRGCPTGATTDEARALLTLIRRLEARLLSRLATIDAGDLGAAEGFPATASWLRSYGNLDHGQATGLVKVARLADQLPALGAVFAEGKIGVSHLQAVAAGAGRVPAEILGEHELTLRDLAPHARPSDLRRVATRIQAGHDESSVRDDAAHTHESRHLTLARTFGDAYHLEGLLEPEAGAAVAAALDALMAPHGPEDTRTAGQRRADALLELTQLGLRSGQLPDSGGDRPRLTFLVTTSAQGGAATTAGPGRLDDLLGRVLTDLAGTITGVGEGSLLSRSQLPGEGRGLTTGVFADGDHLLIGTDAVLPVETLARIACDADVSIAAVDAWGDPPNLGRASRFPSVAQRRALVLRDRGCVFPGCDRPPAHCQAHHLTYWTAGGHTDLANLALVCSFHHHLIHEGRWLLQRTPPGPASAGRPPQPPGWQATAPGGRQLREHRQPAA